MLSNFKNVTIVKLERTTKGTTGKCREVTGRLFCSFMFLIKLNVVNGGVICSFLFFGSFLLLLLNCNGIVNIIAKINNKKN